MPDRPTLGPQSDRIAQAIEVIRSQVQCGPDRAFDLLRDRALLLDQTLEYTALDVLDNIVRFDP
jgi:hypothetical protein